MCSPLHRPAVVSFVLFLAGLRVRASPPKVACASPVSLGFKKGSWFFLRFENEVPAFVFFSDVFFSMCVARVWGDVCASSVVAAGLMLLPASPAAAVERCFCRLVMDGWLFIFLNFCLRRCISSVYFYGL